MKTCVAAWLLALLPACASAVSADELLPVDAAFTLTGNAPSRDGIELDWAIADSYYLYRQRTSVKVQGGGFVAGALQLPAGERHVDEFFGEVETYRNALVAQLPGQATAQAREIQLEIRYQGCADLGVCYPPQTRSLTVVLPPVALGQEDGLAALGRQLGGGAPTLIAAPGLGHPPLPPDQAFGFDAIVGDGNTLLLRFTPAPGYYLYQARSQFRLDGVDGVALGAPRWPPARRHHDEHFGDVEVYFDQVEVAVPVLGALGEATRARLHASFQGCQDEGICYPPITREVALLLPANPETSAAVSAASAAAPSGLLAVLALALIGGIILNLMPCVLPVLSLKVLGLARSGQSRAYARRSALCYSAGVVLSFAVVGLLVLALRSGGQALGWGFQLQQPWFVAVLAYVMFVVGLSLSGVVSFGGSGNFGQALAEKSGPVGDFFTGALACVVASPCIAPFMGGALAYALAAPPLLALTVFMVLGFGLALPFLLVAFLPALARCLPKPGAWMETFKYVMAFPMYLTALWLLWVLGRQRGVDAMALTLVGMLAVALLLWLNERIRWRALNTPNLRWSWLHLCAVYTLALVVIAWQVSWLHTPPRPAAQAQHEAYTPARLAALRSEGRAVFVNMTADWCVTCKLNEARVLARPAFRQALDSAGAAYLVGDWTDTDPEISAFLDAHKAVGVPLYVVYPADGSEGRVLPAILSLDAVKTALSGAQG